MAAAAVIVGTGGAALVPAASAATPQLSGRHDAKVQVRQSVMASAQTYNPSYHFGPLITHVKVVGVVWGTSGATYLPQVQAPSAPNVADFMGNLVNSSWMDLLSEYSANNGTDYSIHRGTLEGMHAITPSAPNNQGTGDNCAPGASLDDFGNIQPELADQIGVQNALPAPDDNTVYVVFTRQGQCVRAGSQNSVNDFCGYHSEFTLNAAPVRYAVIPFGANNAGCGKSVGFGNFTSVISHEIAEAVTDPDGSSGWSDNLYGEVADLCNHTNGKIVTPAKVSYVAQDIYSNQAHKCVATGLRRFVSAGSVSVVEGNAGARTINVPVSLSAPTAIPLSVSFELVPTGGNPATADDDYADIFLGSVSWNPILTPTDKKTVTKYATVTINGDTNLEPDETFDVVLSPGAGYGINGGAGHVTILNDDPSTDPTISIGDGSATVGSKGNGILAIPVTLSAPAAGNVTVFWAMTPGTAGPKQVKGAKAGSVTIPAGSRLATITFIVKPQKVLPTTNTFFTVTLSSPSGASLGRAVATATVVAP